MKLVKIEISMPYFTSGPDSEHYPKWRATVLGAHSLLEPYGVEIDMEKLDEGHYYGVLKNTDLIVTPDQYLDIVISGVDVSKPTCIQNPVWQEGSPFKAVMDKMDKVLKMKPLTGEMNTRCDVHMPGQALSVYNDTMLMENACTDALQVELNNGWRIIAACPQPDQRRPDYILGRFNPKIGD